jgi:hypothetical protein
LGQNKGNVGAAKPPGACEVGGLCTGHARWTGGLSQGAMARQGGGPGARVALADRFARPDEIRETFKDKIEPGGLKS